MSDTRSCKAMAIFIDSTTTIHGNIPKSATVKEAVGRMLPDLANRINRVYDLPTPLDRTTMHVLHSPSDLGDDDKLERVVGPQPFTLLCYPSEEQKPLVQERLKEARNSKQMIVDMNGQLASLMESMKEMKTKLEGSINNLQKRSNIQEGVINNLREKNNTQDSFIAKQGSTIDEMRKRNKEQDSFIAKQGSMIDEMRKRNKEQDSIIAEQGSTIAKQGSTIAKQGSTITKQGSTIDNLRKKNETYDSVIDDLRKKNKEQDSTITKQGATITKQGATIDEQVVTIAQHSVTIERLEAQNEVQKGVNENLQVELRQEKAGRKEDIECLIQVTALIAPLHLRVLLDTAKEKILQVFQCNSWEDLRDNRNIHQLIDHVHRGLANALNCPSRETIRFLCSYNNVRREGNSAAHAASVKQMRDAVTTKQLETRDRRCLEQVFKFTFNEDV